MWSDLSSEVSGFRELGDRLKGLTNQTAGLPQHVCECGEEYSEFSCWALARPDDVAVIENVVANQIRTQLNRYFCARYGRIYWRIPFEWGIHETSVVIKFDELGPDKDFVTDRRCHLDKNWRRVSAYCRVYKATLATMETVATELSS